MLSLNQQLNPQRPRASHDRTFAPGEKVIARHLGEIGWGLFAAVDFAAGETILWLNPKDSRGRFAAWHTTYNQTPSEFGILMVPGFYWLPDETHPFCYINHSCDENCGFIHWGRIEDQGLRIVAYRSIRQGEQFFLDYALMTAHYEIGLDNRMWNITPCLCGSPTCRHQVAAFSTLPPSHQVAAALPNGPVAGRVLAHLIPSLPHVRDALRLHAPSLYMDYLEALQSQIACASSLYCAYGADS